MAEWFLRQPGWTLAQGLLHGRKCLERPRWIGAMRHNCSAVMPAECTARAWAWERAVVLQMEISGTSQVDRGNEAQLVSSNAC